MVVLGHNSGTTQWQLCRSPDNIPAGSATRRTARRQTGTGPPPCPAPSTAALRPSQHALLVLSTQPVTRFCKTESKLGRAPPVVPSLGSSCPGPRAAQGACVHLSGGTCPGSILPFTLTCNFRYWERERLTGLRNSLKATFQDTLNGGSQLCTDSDCWEGRLAAQQPTTLASPSPHYPRPGEAEGWGRTLATRHREIVRLAPGHTACKRQRAIAPSLGAAPYPSPLLSTLTAPTPVEEATAETQGRFMARTACVAALWSSGGRGETGRHQGQQ